MAIPVISETLSFLQSIIQAMPKSLRYIFFLAFVIGAFALLPFLFHMIGFHCNSDRNIVKTSTFSFIGNAEIALQDPRELFNASSFTPYELTGITECTYYVRYISEGLYEVCTDTDNFTGCVYGLLYSPKLLGDDPVCINSTNFSCVSIVRPSFGSTSGNCLSFSDAYRKNDDEIYWWQRYATCNSDCTPPPNYAYNATTNTFNCIDLDVCGTANTTIKYKIDVLLEKHDAERFYSQSGSDKDYKNAVKFACDSSFNPQITIFGLPIFDYKIWIALIVLGAMFFWLSHVGRH